MKVFREFSNPITSLFNIFSTSLKIRMLRYFFSITILYCRYINSILIDIFSRIFIQISIIGQLLSLYFIEYTIFHVDMGFYELPVS